MDFTSDSLITLEQLPDIRSRHGTIAFCSGCYDVLHSGHVLFFKQCRQFADTLVVGIGKDSTLRTLKGKNRPINPEMNRLYLVASLGDVDYAVLNDDQIREGKIDFYNAISTLRPDVFVLNDNDSAIEQKTKICDELGIQLELVPRIVPEFLKSVSSSEIAEKIKWL